MTADLRVVLAEMRERAEGVNAYATTDLPALLDAVEAVLGLMQDYERRGRWTLDIRDLRDAITDALGGTA